MNLTKEFVIVGKVGATYGIQGWVKITSFTESIAHILKYHPWYLEEGSDWQAIEVESGREHGKGLVVKIAGFDNPEEARQLTGKTIAVARSQLPPLKQHEYYWSDLVGLTVIDQHDEVLGKIAYFIETGSNDVFVVQGKREHAIPYLPGQVVTSIDLEAQIIRVNWDII